MRVIFNIDINIVIKAVKNNTFPTFHYIFPLFFTPRSRYQQYLSKQNRRLVCCHTNINTHSKLRIKLDLQASSKHCKSLI